jgi:DNA-directed RNA polymerase subunit RPC12/RpoP
MSTIRFYCVICGTALEASADSHHDLLECHACTRHVPVPRPVGLMGKFTKCQSVLPPRVLEITVTFQCMACESRLRTDARWEGRQISCPDCGGTTEVPRWSTVPSWPRSPEALARARVPAMPPPVRAKASVLSDAEIDFLRGEASRSSGGVV